MDMNELTDNEKLRDYILDELLPEYIPYEMEKVTDPTSKFSLKIPEIDCLADVKVISVQEKGVHIRFDFYSNKYAFGFGSGTGQAGDDVISAAGRALSFIQRLSLSGLFKMFRGEAPVVVETEFEGNKHRWYIYAGDVQKYEKGRMNLCDESESLLPLVMPDLIKRLGNQRLSNLMIFGNRNHGSAVLLNGLQISDINKKVDSHVDSLAGDPDAAWQQSIYILQDEATYIPGIYGTVEEKQKCLELLKEYLVIIKNSFGNVLSPEEIEDAKLMLGDPAFVEVCQKFLPEICMIRSAAVMQGTFDDMIELYTADGIKHDVSVAQLTDFYMLDGLMNKIATNKEMGEDYADSWDEIWRKLNSSSKLRKYLKHDVTKNKWYFDMNGGKLQLHMGADYELR